MSLAKRKKFLEKMDNIGLVVSYILIGCLFILIYQNPNNIFSDNYWLPILLMLIVVLCTELIKYIFFNGIPIITQLNEISEILREEKINSGYSGMIYNRTYDDYFLDIVDKKRFIKEREEYYYKIKNENPNKIKIIDDELSRYGDLIDGKDLEYASRVNMKKELEKEVISVELEVERLKDDLKRKKDELSLFIFEEEKKRRKDQ